MLAEERRAENTGAGSGGLGTRGAARAGVCVGGDTTSRPCHIAAKLHLPQRVPVLPPASATEAPAPGRREDQTAPEENQRFWAPKALGGKAGTGCQQGRLSQTLSHLGGAGCPGTQEAAAQGHVVFGAGLPRWDLLAPPSFLVCLSSPLRPCGSFVPAEASAAGRELGRQVKKASWKRRDSGGV